VLLLAPLAKAAAGDGAAQGLRRAVASILAGLTVADARDAYEAIRLASPGGMGRVDRLDVTDEVDVTLLEAMTEAQGRDAVAREYTSDFAVTFELGHPALRDAWAQGHGLSEAVVRTFLTILAEVPDTLIARKRGEAVARDISSRAAECLAARRRSSSPERAA
jgi:triphosphoribosyl-dephospho-CoA synthase